ncbi:MAG: yidA [Myxococcales bacterium]|nr:yidA [Myxococcales bacterium]
MRYHALAADYDGTLAHHGKIDEPTWAALRRLKESGRRLIMVTGRELDELLELLPHPEVFDRIVAENGGVIYEPATKDVRTVAAGPSAAFVAELVRRGVTRISVGRVIVATWEPHQDKVLGVIRDQGLELQVIFNKGSVMILPPGVNKASGLQVALTELGLSPHNVVGVGDAENDHALLTACECGVAVANALPSLKQTADFVTEHHHGMGVSELVEHLIANDLITRANRLKRHRVLLGRHGDREISIDPYSANIMVCGTSGSGKSTLTTGLLERLCKHGYQFAIVDPEGDYASVEIAVVLGSHKRAPLVEEVMDVLRDAQDNCVVNMLGVSVEHRPEFFAQLLPAIGDLRARTGRPHWLVIDEAHHMLPASWQPAEEMTLRAHGTVYITVHPGSVAGGILSTIDTVLAVGEHPEQTLREFAEVAGLTLPPVAPIEKLAPGHTMYWKIGENPIEVVTEKPKMERTRHSRKYTEGNLGHDRSFFFRGADGRLNLKAHNLQLFIQIGIGVDDETWLFHLRKGEYSRWIRTEVKDGELSDEIARIEADTAVSAAASREAIKAAIDKRYTLPSDKPSGLVD